MRKLMSILAIFIVILMTVNGCSSKPKDEVKEKVEQTKSQQEEKLLDSKALNMVKEKFRTLDKSVDLYFFTQEVECKFCKDTRKLLNEVEAQSNKVNVKIFDFMKDKKVAKEFGIDKIPAIVVKKSDGKDQGVRFYGIPAGYEFGTLLDAINLISTDNHALSDNIAEKVKNIDEPVHIQVYVTPTCPYCPKVVQLGHKMASINENITSDMVEASEYMYLVNKYGVSGVPHTVINEDHKLVGMVGEEQFLSKILEAIK